MSTPTHAAITLHLGQIIVTLLDENIRNYFFNSLLQYELCIGVPSSATYGQKHEVIRVFLPLKPYVPVRLSLHTLC